MPKLTSHCRSTVDFKYTTQNTRTKIIIKKQEKEQSTHTFSTYIPHHIYCIYRHSTFSFQTTSYTSPSMVTKLSVHLSERAKKK